MSADFPPSALDFLLGGIFGPGDCVLAIFLDAFVDASGQESDPLHEDPTLTVAACVARREVWVALERQWDYLLASFDVPYMHMKRFAQRKEPFAHLDNSQRDMLIALLSHALITLPIARLTTSLRLRDFHRADATHIVSENFGGAYSACGMRALAIMWDFIVKKANRQALGCDPDEPSYLKTFIEEGDAGQFHLRNLTALNPRLNASFLPKKLDTIEGDSVRYVRPFEVADLVAYEWRRIARDPKSALDPKTRRMRASQVAFGVIDKERVWHDNPLWRADMHVRLTYEDLVAMHPERESSAPPSEPPESAS